jgi:DNA polymerase alpha subunit A
MSGRSRRPVEEKPSRVAGALAQLAAAKAGQKRALNFEVKQEEAIYDVVDEDQYEQITAKRRMDAGVGAVAVVPQLCGLMSL